MNPYFDAKTPCLKCGRKRPTIAVTYKDPYCSRRCADDAYGTQEMNRTEVLSQLRDSLRGFNLRT